MTSGRDEGKLYEQYRAGLALAWPDGHVIFVSSTNGNDGNDGEYPWRALKTLARAEAVATAGDTIILEPGGSETLTAGITLNVDHVKIVCPVANPRQGYKLTGSGALDLLAISSDDCHVEGLWFYPSAGTTHSAAGIQLAAGADRAVIKNCLFDNTAITTTYQGWGVELVGAVVDTVIDGCEFRDCMYGVTWLTGTSDTVMRTKIKDCLFYVGQTAAFGVGSQITGSGAIQGVVLDGCSFVEAKGSGAAAAAAWNGSTGADATRGPILFEAGVDQFLVQNCRAYTALAQAFSTLNAINAGAAGDLVNCASGVGSDTTAAVDSVGVVASGGMSAAVSAASGVASLGTSNSTANSSTLSVATSAYSGIVSLATSNSGAHSSTLSVATSAMSGIVSLATSNALSHSSSLSAVVSTGSGVVSLAASNTLSHSSTLSAVASAGSGVVSLATSNALSHSSSLSAVVSLATSNALSHSSSLSAVVSTGSGVVSLAASNTLSHSSSLSAIVSTGSGIVSYAASGSAAHSSTLSVATSAMSGIVSMATSTSVAFSASLVQQTKAGRWVAVKDTMADTDMGNNAQQAQGAFATATGGDVMIEEIIFQKDGTALDGCTNIEVTCDNVNGPTGATNLMANVKAGLAANLKLLATAGGVTAFTRMVLESGKKLYAQGNDGAPTDAGATVIYTYGMAMTDGAYLA